MDNLLDALEEGTSHRTAGPEQGQRTSLLAHVLEAIPSLPGDR